jgi:hypothetical protein
MEIEISPTRQRELILMIHEQMGMAVTQVLEGREGTLFLQGERTASLGQGVKAKYVCKHNWPIEFFLLVRDDKALNPKEKLLDNVITEVFQRPNGDAKKPVLFQANIRGKIETMIAARARTADEAEDLVWQTWVKIRDCEKHELEPLSENAARSKCKHCPLVTRTPE